MRIVGEFCQNMLIEATERGFSEDDTFEIHLALEEAMIKVRAILVRLVDNHAD